MSVRGREVLSGLTVAVLFALPLLPEILGARRLVFRDAQITHWPWRRAAVESLASGRLPLVNIAASGGEPLLANPNAVLLYPTMLLEKVVSPAAAFTFSGIMMSYASAFANSGPAASWLPWCAAATLDLVRSGRRMELLRAAAAAGIAFGLQLLAGEPALSLLTVLFAGFLGTAEIFSGRQSRLARARNLVGGGA